MSDGYIPDKLVAEGVIVVTTNHRLGMLGFLAHPALAAESPNGASDNYGLMHQHAALLWVRRNIRASAAIRTTSRSSASPQADSACTRSSRLRWRPDSFHKAIVESGAYSLSQPSLEAAGTAFATAAGCAVQTAACLRGLSVQTILANQIGATMVPNVDGFVLPQTVGSALRAASSLRRREPGQHRDRLAALTAGRDDAQAEDHARWSIEESLRDLWQCRSRTWRSSTGAGGTAERSAASAAREGGGGCSSGTSPASSPTSGTG